METWHDDNEFYQNVKISLVLRNNCHGNPTFLTFLKTSEIPKRQIIPNLGFTSVFPLASNNKRTSIKIWLMGMSLWQPVLQGDGFTDCWFYWLLYTPFASFMAQKNREIVTAGGYRDGVRSMCVSEDCTWELRCCYGITVEWKSSGSHWMKVESDPMTFLSWTLIFSFMKTLVYLWISLIWTAVLMCSVLYFAITAH